MVLLVEHSDMTDPLVRTYQSSFSGSSKVTHGKSVGSEPLVGLQQQSSHSSPHSSFKFRIRKLDLLC